jgi:cell volume regulation protein A
VQVVAVLRSRRERPSSLVALADGRYAVVTAGVVAIGGRQALARWSERRADRAGDDPAERAWWQEVIGALIARG